MLQGSPNSGSHDTTTHTLVTPLNRHNRITGSAALPAHELMGSKAHWLTSVSGVSRLISSPASPGSSAHWHRLTNSQDHWPRCSKAHLFTGVLAHRLTGLTGFTGLTGSPARPRTKKFTHAVEQEGEPSKDAYRGGKHFWLNDGGKKGGKGHERRRT